LQRVATQLSGTNGVQRGEIFTGNDGYKPFLNPSEGSSDYKGTYENMRESFPTLMIDRRFYPERSS